MLVVSAGIQVDMRMFQRPEDRMTAVAAAERQRSKAIAQHKRQSAATSRYAAPRGTECVLPFPFFVYPQSFFVVCVLPSFPFFALMFHVRLVFVLAFLFLHVYFCTFFFSTLVFAFVFAFVLPVFRFLFLQVLGFVSNFFHLVSPKVLLFWYTRKYNIYIRDI